MHVIITMAGHSRRFHEAGYEGPKALLPLGGRPMIAHAVDMFAADDSFHFVANQQQVADDPSLIETLHSLASDTTITIVPPHELGPTWSALQVEGIPLDEPVIVSYCDFTVAWDYRLFLRHVEGADGAIPAFRGFHPASFGDTFYAYMRTDGDRMLELREKRSFTADRTQELASVGSYYFGSWALFREYAGRLLAAEGASLPEAYVSLLFNAMVADGLDVVVHEVERFVCLGTPEDVEQYRFWHRYFGPDGREAPVLVSSALPTPQPADDGRGGAERVALVPMAGQGQRFRAEGYRTAKPLIEVGGVPMVLRAAASMPAADRWIFLPRAQDLERHRLEETLRGFVPDCEIIPVVSLTSGQAATCLLAETSLPADAELLIASCDYETRYDEARWRSLLEDRSVDGAVWTCRMPRSMIADPTAFAYCRLAPDGVTIAEVVEKRPISAHPERDPLVVGTFWYRRAADFVRGARSMIERGIAVNGEHYVGTSINTLIEQSARFVVFDIEQWVSFGNPHELRLMEYWQDYFKPARARR